MAARVPNRIKGGGGPREVICQTAAEQRQQEQSHHIVRCHDGAGNGLVQVKGVRQNQGNQIVIHLPEGTDGQEREAHQDCALGVRVS